MWVIGSCRGARGIQHHISLGGFKAQEGTIIVDLRGHMHQEIRGESGFGTS
jgi:hypothetical protein